MSRFIVVGWVGDGSLLLLFLLEVASLLVLLLLVLLILSVWVSLFFLFFLLCTTWNTGSDVFEDLGVEDVKEVETDESGIS